MRTGNLPGGGHAAVQADLSVLASFLVTRNESDIAVAASIRSDPPGIAGSV